MKKIFVSMFILAMLATVTPALAADTAAAARHDAVFWVGKTTYLVDGAAKTFDVAPYMENDRTYVPVRYLAEMLGMQAAWDDKTQTVTLSGQKTIKLVIGQSTMTVNGQSVKMDVTPELRDGRTMLPARWVAENAGNYGVDWMDKLQMVQVWPLELVGGKWRVPPENIRPAIKSIKEYWGIAKVDVDTAAGLYTFADGFSVPSTKVNYSYGVVEFYFPFEEMLRYMGFPVKYNVDYCNNGDIMTIWGVCPFGPLRAQIAIGSDKMLRGTWDKPFDVTFGPNQGITKPYRGPHREFMIDEGETEDYLFSKGSETYVIDNTRTVIGTEFYFDKDAM